MCINYILLYWSNKTHPPFSLPPLKRLEVRASVTAYPCMNFIVFNFAYPCGFKQFYSMCAFAFWSFTAQPTADRSLPQALQSRPFTDGKNSCMLGKEAWAGKRQASTLRAHLIYPLNQTGRNFGVGFLVDFLRNIFAFPFFGFSEIRTLSAIAKLTTHISSLNGKRNTMTQTVFLTDKRLWGKPPQSGDFPAVLLRAVFLAEDNAVPSDSNSRFNFSKLYFLSNNTRHYILLHNLS